MHQSINQQAIASIQSNFIHALGAGGMNQNQFAEVVAKFTADLLSEANKQIPTAPHIFTALTEMQAEISQTGIEKSLEARTQDGKLMYKARGIDDVYKFLSPLFARFGVVIGVDCKSRETDVIQLRNSVAFQTTVTVEYSFTSKVDGSSHKITIMGEARDSGDKGLPKALSMAFKYACFQVLCIPVCDDPDATVHDKIPFNEYEGRTQYNNNQYGRQNRQNQQRGHNQQQQQNHNQQRGHNQQQQQSGQDCITKEQAIQLQELCKKAGQDPKQVLKFYNIQRMGELTLQQLNATTANLNRYLDEQQKINQQHGQQRQQQNQNQQRGHNQNGQQQQPGNQHNGPRNYS